MSKKKLEKALANSEKTKSISIDFDDFEASELPSVFAALAKLPRLQEVTLEGEIEELPSELGLLTQIKKLFITVLEGGPDLLPPEIGALANLEELDIERNFMAHLPEAIGKLKNLKRLTISQTELKEFPSSIGQLAALEELDCSECNLREMPEEICALSKLKRLSLEGLLTHIPDTIGKLQQLEVLFLGGKFLTVPAAIAELSNLSSLYIRGRFEKIDRGYFDSSPPFQRQTLAADLEQFVRLSREKWEQHKKTVPWPLIEDSKELLVRPLRNVPVLTSFKNVGLVGEEVLIKPATPTNINAAKAIADGSPLVFVSEAEPTTPETIEGLCKVGVLGTLLEFYPRSGEIDLRIKCTERVHILSIKKGAEIVFADVDSIAEEKADSSGMAEQLRDKALARYETYMDSIRTPKAKKLRELKKFEADFPKAVKRGVASFFVGSIIGLSYGQRQALLTERNEHDRLLQLSKLLS